MSRPGLDCHLIGHLERLSQGQDDLVCLGLGECKRIILDYMLKTTWSHYTFILALAVFFYSSFILNYILE